MTEESEWPNYHKTMFAERNLAIYKARRAGRTLNDVGKEFGVTQERVRQIWFQGERILEEQAAVDLLNVLNDGAYMRDLCIAYCLSQRIRWMVEYMEWNTLPIREFAHTVTPKEVSRIPNIGKKSMAELCCAIRSVIPTDAGYWGETGEV